MLFNDNIDIALPAGFEPYPAQRAVISAALSALTSSTHALLESPTGTGKSLALLCATLGFAAHYRTEELKRLIEQHHPEAAEGSLADLEATGFADKLKEEIPVPRIWYATRTHSQVAHLVNELRRTPYRPKITVLASREQYCINSVVISNATALSHGNKNTACKEAVEKGRCHYFRNVAMLSPADGEILDVEDIVSRGRRLQACPYYASREMVRTAELIVCPYQYLIDPVLRTSFESELRGAIVVFDEAHNIEDVCREAASIELTAVQLAAIFALLQTIAGPDSSSAKSLSALIERCLRFLDSTPAGSYPGNVLPDALLLNPGDAENFTTLLKDLAGEQSGEGSDLSLGDSSGDWDLLVRFIAVLRLYDAAETQVVVQAVSAGEFGASVNRDTFTGPPSKVLCVWSLHAGTAFKPLAAQCRSVLVTSGTLSPLNALATSLGASFPHAVEAPHAIPPSHLYAAVVSAFGGVRLDGSFRNVDQPAYQDAVGQAIVRLASVVPEGLVVFAPSHGVLSKLMQRWRSPESRVLAEIEKFKRVFVESQNAGPGNNPMTVLRDYERTIHGGQGAVLFAVCRGRISEGTDLRDGLCRCVAVLGIPYANVRDPKVTILRSKRGESWYVTQAMRAVNQALGRAVRHARDYGSVVLLDARYAPPQMVGMLSSWIRGAQGGVQCTPMWELVEAGLVSFYRQIKPLPSGRVVVVKPQPGVMIEVSVTPLAEGPQELWPQVFVPGKGVFRVGWSEGKQCVVVRHGEGPWMDESEFGGLFSHRQAHAPALTVSAAAAAASSVVPLAEMTVTQPSEDVGGFVLTAVAEDKQVAGSGMAAAGNPYGKTEKSKHTVVKDKDMGSGVVVEDLVEPLKKSAKSKDKAAKRRRIELQRVASDDEFQADYVEIQTPVVARKKRA